MVFQYYKIYQEYKHCIPGEYYEEGQKIRFYYEPPRENRIPGSVYIGSYEEQIIVLE